MAKATRKLVPRDDRITINHEFASLDAFIAEYVTNISRSGVFIRTRYPLDVGTKVNLRFTVIMDDIETIEGIGEVVRVQVSPPGMGVVFVTLTSHSQTLIQSLITQRRSPAVSQAATRARAQTQPPPVAAAEPPPARPARTTRPPPLPPLPPASDTDITADEEILVPTPKARATRAVRVPPPPPPPPAALRGGKKKTDG